MLALSTRECKRGRARTAQVQVRTVGASHGRDAAALVPGSTAAVVRVEPVGVVVESAAGERTVPIEVARLTFVARA